ncbi:papain-like cysteine protease family protein [Roseomonas sp. CAU 1739]|uniref:papain-like cysteine protease family protein n=1 Tax=Roseomonas sp. CAU 1739 TaxID=3140364 RepID=UPI00325A5956
MNRRLLFATAAAGLMPASVRAKPGMPPPIDLGIANIAQQTPLWCWAAVAEQIITWRRGDSPPQCALVAAAFGASAQRCCGDARACVTTGGLQQIQALLARFGGAASLIASPVDPIALYRMLADERPVILAVRMTPYSGHVVLLRGMAWMPTPAGPAPLLTINDPLGHFTQPVPFFHLLPYWQAAIVLT